MPNFAIVSRLLSTRLDCANVSWKPSSAPARALRSIKSRDRPELRRRLVGEIEHHLVHVAPAPAFRWIIALDDRVSGGVEVLCRMPVGRAVATADMPAGAAEPQMDPRRSGLEAFLAPARARRDFADALEMRANVPHRVPHHDCSNTIAAPIASCGPTTMRLMRSAAGILACSSSAATCARSRTAKINAASRAPRAKSGGATPK